MKLLKPILAGVLIGATLFYMPFFVLRVVAVVLIIGALFRIFGGRRFGGGFHRGLTPGFTDNIRNMSDEEYQSFKQHYAGSCGWNPGMAGNENNETRK